MRLGPLKIEAGGYDIVGKHITSEKIEGFEGFYEEKVGVSIELFQAKIFSGIINGEGSFKPNLQIGELSASDFMTIEIGGTIPDPRTGAAVNVELHIHLNQLLRKR